MPESMDEEALTKWARDLAECDIPPGECRSCRTLARAVLALVDAERLKEREACRSQTEAKVRKAVRFCSYDDETDAHINDIVARVMGTEARQGREEVGRGE